MDRRSLFILVVLFLLWESAPSLQVHALNSTDVQAAVMDMRSKSYYGFAILLQMLNATSQPYRMLTFLMPSDSELSASPISIDHLEDFLISHAVPMPLLLNDFLHFPTGSLIPSGVENKMIRINNRGRANFVVNNAHIVTPNICQNSYIKCHGIDAVIKYDNGSSISS
ncbi:hypothetical protein EV2_038225 [Malus domestica]